MQKLTIIHAFYRARLKLAEWGEDLNELHLPLLKADYAKDIENMAEIENILNEAWAAKLEGILGGEKA